MKTIVRVSTNIARSARVAQVEGIFDVPPTKASALSWEVDLPLDDKPWNVGLIVGPSGSGKSTVARAAFGPEMEAFEALRADMLSRPTKSLLDGFPAELGVKDVVALLSSVGFSSPPAWLRPFNVLSNGEQFRVMMARVLAEARSGKTAVVDEYTSVVDRTVAQVGSCALAKAVRRAGNRFVAVACHEDIEPWLQPDWVYRPAEQSFAWRSVQPRPSINLTVYRVQHTAWTLFRHHHYLTHEINKSAICFVAYATFPGQGRRLVAFDAWLPFVGRLKTKQLAKRGHRTVCLPDFQGIGIGAAIFTLLSRMWKGLGFRVFSGTAHPAEIAARKRNPSWRMTAGPSMSARDTGAQSSMGKARATERLVARFEWEGDGLPELQAKRLLNNWTKV